MIKHVLKDIDVYVDGRGYAGVAEEVEPPKLEVRTEEFRPAGYDAPMEIDMGLNKLECTITTTGISKDLMRLWGVTTGDPVGLTLRGAQEDGLGAVESVRMDLRGRGKTVDPGTWKTGARVPSKMMFSLVYYKLEVDGEVMHEVDVPGMIRIVNGVDQLAARRAALGR